MRKKKYRNPTRQNSKDNERPNLMRLRVGRTVDNKKLKRNDVLVDMRLKMLAT
jgi:hypothetical protein